MAVRAWSMREPTESAQNEKAGGGNPSKPRTKRRYPQEALIFDTETEPGLGQELKLLVWRFYRDSPGSRPGHFCVEEGLAYPDDLPIRDPDGFQVLCDYTAGAWASTSPGARRELLLRPLSWWLQERLFAYGYRHRDRCLIVGFNLPFDLAAVASHWGEAKGYYLGGFSLGIWGEFDEGGVWRDRKFHPRLMMKAIDPRRTLFGWGFLKREDADSKGSANNFLDLRTLAFALTDCPYNLEGACKAFGDPYEKPEVSFDRITPQLIAYAREDVEHTALLYRHTMAELACHPGVDLRPEALYSPATVGARYLEAMGLQRPLEKFSRLKAEQLGWNRRRIPRPRARQVSEEILGASMSAFYGGRAETRLIRTPVPVVHVDFTSMYPAINALLGTWPILRAEKIKVSGVTQKVRALLADPKLHERCLKPETWREIGVTLVELEPDGDILPVRAGYDPEGLDFGIGVNPLHYEGRLWFALPDVVAATALNPDKVPRVVRAIRLSGVGIQGGLQPVRLRGGLELDPSGDRDPFLVMIEERARVRKDSKLSEEERDRRQLFLKITANGTSYGSLARFDRRNLGEAAPLNVYGPDEEARGWSTKTPEDAGPFCFPPIAASITAGARLMLALLERFVTDAGGTYALCDTDSMAIVAAVEERVITCPSPDGSDEITAISHGAVREILGRFEALNPYEPNLKLRPWKVEYNSLEEPLWCYAISAKRYCLYRVGPEGEPEIISTAEDQLEEGELEPPFDDLTDWSEHGLGAYMDPSGRKPEDQRDGQGRRIWIREAWEWIIGNALGRSTPLPPWAGRPALTRFTVSNPGQAGWFPHSKVRPGSFGLLAHPESTFYGAPDNGGGLPGDVAMPAAPYEEDPELWGTLPWQDRHTGAPVRLLTLDERLDLDLLDGAVSGGAVVVETMGRVLTRYICRPEHKSLAPDGGPVGPDTVGLLRRRSVEGRPEETLLIGKEGNQLIERSGGQIDGPGEYRNEYGMRADGWERVLERLKEIGAAKLVEQTGFSRSAVYAVLGGARPHPKNRPRYEEIGARIPAESGMDRSPLGRLRDPS